MSRFCTCRLTDKNDYYKSSQTKEKTKWNQLNQIKENKNSFETSFRPRNENLESFKCRVIIFY